MTQVTLRIPAVLHPALMVVYVKALEAVPGVDVQQDLEETSAQHVRLKLLYPCYHPGLNQVQQSL